jgi:glyoxylase-like metal-dependent hydrolase (beta-lactamase superfamily II)
MPFTVEFAAAVADRPRVIRVLAPNPGPFTLEGTNTWVIGRHRTLVIDPGPEDRAHIEAVARAAGVPEAILLTHRHPDHAPGARLLAEGTGAPVMAFRPEPGEEALQDGVAVETADTRLETVHTPGHTEDHVAFHDAEHSLLFTGDAVLGRGTSVVDPPHGDLGAYLRSLNRMLELRPSVLYPGHGPVVWSGTAKLQEYLDHRRHRDRQVLAALRHGPRNPEDLVPDIYAGYPIDLHPAAARSVLAHLLKLEGEGRVVRAGRPGEELFALRPDRIRARRNRATE